MKKSQLPIPSAKLAYNTNEAAAMISVSPATIMRLRKAGKLHPARGVRRPTYTHDELLRFLRDTMPKGGAL